MNSKEVSERFKELNNDNKITCTQEELNDFLMCGILLKFDKSYVTRNNDKIKVNVIKSKNLDFDIDFSEIIEQSEALAKEHHIYRIYCMSKRCYNNYKEQGLIITQNELDYFRYFQGELWLVNII